MAFPDAVASWSTPGASPPLAASSVVTRAPQFDRSVDRLRDHCDVPHARAHRTIADRTQHQQAVLASPTGAGRGDVSSRSAIAPDPHFGDSQPPGSRLSH